MEKFAGDILDRIYLVSDKTFSVVVNSNLEVRTSVSINPRTGRQKVKPCLLMRQFQDLHIL